MKPALEALLQHPSIFRPGDDRGPAGLASGWPVLDAALPGGGWPRRALIELLPAGAGIGELSLLLPALRQAMTAGQGMALVHPPYVPYAPALQQAGLDPAQVLFIRPPQARDGVWAMEACLRSGILGAVLGWLEQPVTLPVLRRLALAAETQDGLAFVFRPMAAAEQPSPAALRMALAPRLDGLQVTVLKCRGRPPRSVFVALDPRDA